MSEVEHQFEAAVVSRTLVGIFVGLGVYLLLYGAGWLPALFADDISLRAICSKSIGFIDKKGLTVIEPQFDEACPFSGGLAAVQPHDTENRCYDNPSTYIDKAGNLIATKQKYSTTRSKTPLFKVQIDDKMSYQDKNGEIVLPPKWDNADDFMDGVALVTNWRTPTQESGYWKQHRYLIDETGKTIFDFDNYIVDEKCSDGLITVSDERTRQAGVVDIKGKLTLLSFSGRCGRFSEGRATASPNKGKNGIVDLSGNFVVLPTYDWLGHYSEGLVNFRMGSEKGYLDRNGKVVIKMPAEASGLGEFHEGLAEVTIGGTPGSSQDVVSRDDGKIGFIDKTGNFVIQPQFSVGHGLFEHGFHEGLAAVGVGSGRQQRFGYIDRTGTFVIQPKFLGAMRFSEGMAAVIFEHYISLADMGKYAPRTK